MIKGGEEKVFEELIEKTYEDEDDE